MTGLVCVRRRQLLPDTDDTDGMFIAVFMHAGDAAAGRGAEATPDEPPL